MLIDGYHQEAVSHVKNNGDRLMKRMVFSSCHDLVLSRFCAIDYKDHGIAGIKIHKIIRVHNRMLRARFDEKLYSILPGGAQEPTRVLEEGFLDADSYQGLSRDGAVPLSNSLSLADRHRINYITRHNKIKENIDSCSFKYGQIVISKVYLGKSVKAIDDRSITRNAYPKINSVFKPKKMCSLNGTTDGQGCECSSRQCEWYIFDHELVLPEYIVEFEYVTKLRSKSLFSHFSDVLLDNRECKVPAVSKAEEDVTVDDDVINMQPQSQARPRLIALTDELILKSANADTLEKISVLNLHGNGLTKLKPLQSLTHLKRLTVSFNDVTKLDELSHSNLEYLDASFNKIVTLDGFKNVHHLKFLDLSWNQLTHTRDELSMMRKYTPNLVTLDLRHNSFQKPENLRLRVIGRLKSLTLLDGSAVTEIEATAALRVAAGSRISQLSLLSHARTNPEKARSLSLMPTPQILEKLSRNKPEKIGDHDNQWFLKVTSLNLDGQHITKISGLEKLENLKWASFNNNDLTKIEGLEHCVKLEELCLENNCISKVEGISKLTMLRKLSLGYNYITNLDNCGLHYLVYLHYLSIENNEINSLAGLQKVNSIVELYVGNNAISNVREIFNLKVLSNLVILDLFGNPVCFDTDNYRLFIIYHLKNLKALDGSAIEASEGNMAKDTFGGRLTPDFVAEKLGHATFHDVRELDLPNCAVRIVDLGMGDAFINLRSVNLEHNNMTSFSGLVLFAKSQGAVFKPQSY
ncbi:hypothetical protein KUTeg_013130 [Tegillarca granosa]|uniref:Uncharacterized protein n=1 Tax=Tegillarca granosa TaxID=220873 RepID=A0ABQ9EST8_TEGGR|nr:hypothetical protein KUTeg_013130 [Tegillarca granosa]